MIFPPPPPAPTPAPDHNRWADYWYYTIGCNVIPSDTKKKKTWIRWSEWQILPLPEEQFEAWKQQGAYNDGLAIIPGELWRGEQKGNYLIFIDCDNKKAIQEICTLNGKTVTLQDIAQKFIIEQHRDDLNKCHIFFYSEIPFEKKSSDIIATTPTLDQKTSPENIPAFEVKGRGTHGIAYVTPSIHKNGHPYEIIGTRTPILLDPSEAHGMMDLLDAICRKHKLKYLKDSSSSIGVYGDYGDDHDYGDADDDEDESGAADTTGKNLIPISEIEKDNFVVYEGHNRHEILLRYMESRINKLRKKKIPLHEIKQLCYIKNQKMCVPPLDDKEFERQWKDASKFVKKNEEQGQEGAGGEEQQQQPNPQPKITIEATPVLTRELTYEETAVILSTSIKKDHAAKVISFSGMLLAQTNEDQVTVGYQAESSSGKSWIPLELSAYFPENEVQLIASASPTAFFHDGGNWDKDRKMLLVDLEHKILIFIDQPHFLLQEKLRPLLSHDRKELIYKITDKSQKHGLRTKNVILRGYPSAFFCTTNMDPDEQEKTRMILLSPETDQSKLYESLELTALRKGNYEEYSRVITQDPKRAWLKNRIYLIRQWGIREIILPADGRTVFERFIKEHPYLQPRHQRDFPRIFNLIKSHALLNCFNREKVKPDTIVATEVDIEAGFKLYKEIERSNELGLSPYIHIIYEDVMVPLLRKLPKDSDGEAINGLTKEEIMKRHYEVRHKPLSPDMLKAILLQLESVGLIKQEPDPEDRRKTRVYPTVSSNIPY
jgi:hypothetical protein